MDDENEVRSDPLLGDLVGFLRRPVAVGDRAVPEAMARLRTESRRARWLPRAGLAAALAASVALAIFGSRQAGRPSPVDGVTFALSAPSAARVALIGDFNDWNPDANPLRRGKGLWSVTLRLKPGRYRYSFVVDGSSWRADPRTPPAEDDFGTPTSVITVPN
jgi:Glycogen recognition site of AMP-activated protein kinase